MNKFDLTNTKTAMNLAAAFAGECQARTRYLFYSEVAKEEGYPTIEQVFLETGDNERGHAEIFYDYLTSGLNGQALATQAVVPIEKSDTKKNLMYSIAAESEEATSLYLKFAKEAEDEGLTLIAVTFAEIAKIEARHSARFSNLLQRLEQNMLFSLPYEVTWECTNCGLRTINCTAPSVCPSCHHSRNYFKTACADIAEI